MESSVRDFVTENPNADYAAIEQRFGTPQQIAASCIEEMDAQELTLQLRIRKTIVRIVAATALVLVLLWAGVVVTALIRHVKAMNGYLIVGEAEVIDRTEYTEGKRHEKNCLLFVGYNIYDVLDGISWKCGRT